MFVRRFIYGLPHEVFVGSNLSCEAITQREVLCGLVRMARHFRRNNFSNIDVTDVARTISKFIIPFYFAVHTSTISIINECAVSYKL